MLTIFQPGCHVKRKSESRVELSTCDQLPFLSLSIYIYKIHVHRVSNFALLLLENLISRHRLEVKVRGEGEERDTRLVHYFLSLSSFFSPFFRSRFPGLPKVWDLGGGKLLGGWWRGGTFPERVACGQLGRDLEEGGETGYGEGAVSQPHLQRL